MGRRLIVPVSFDNNDDYKFVKEKPNSSHYIRELVRKDREKIKSDNNYIEEKVKELKQYIDRKLLGVNGAEIELNQDLQEDIKKALIAFD